MEEKRIYYVGIDHGNHLMKTSNHVFENGVERQAVKLPSRLIHWFMRAHFIRLERSVTV
mgnify:CR=1 FL=1